MHCVDCGPAHGDCRNECDIVIIESLVPDYFKRDSPKRITLIFITETPQDLIVEEWTYVRHEKI